MVAKEKNMGKRGFFVVFLISICSHLWGHNLPNALNSQYYFEDLLKVKFDKPVLVTSPPGENSLYIVEKKGLVFKLDDHTSSTKKLVIDFSHKVDDKGESGFLGLAFHPNYAVNKTLFVFYTSTYKKYRVQILSKLVEESLGKYQEDILIRQYDEAGNHNGGDLHFGPDGYLYVSLGDEGKANDFYNNSQRIDKDFFSGILRIDVDLKDVNLWPNPHDAIVLNQHGKSRFKIPNDNPWVHAKNFGSKELDPLKVRTEFWAIGLRNPWRMSFDQKGTLWIGDVGQGTKEEINVIPMGRGGLNFGWAFREGRDEFQKGGANREEYTDPIYEYGRKGFDATYLGRSVTGGVVNESELIPEMKNWYFFSDYINGNVWALNQKGDSEVEVKHITHNLNISSFALHPETKEVLAVDMNQGKILVLKKNKEKAKEIPKKLSQTGLFENMSDFQVNRDFVAYKTNINFWADHAHQKKWFKIPAGEKFQYAKEKSWLSPKGTIWIQHFEMEKVRGKAESRFHVETRVLVKTHDGAYGLSYRWDEDQKDATLVESHGDMKSLKISVDGEEREQLWKFPSRAECVMCHNSINGFSLGMRTRQLNHDVFKENKKVNFISWLFKRDLLDRQPTKQDWKKKFYSIHDEKAKLNDRVRGYLDVNCAMCHHKNGPTPVPLDMQIAASWKNTRLEMKALNNMGQDKLKVVDPGKVDNSVLLKRLKASDGFTKMPFIGNLEVDHEAAKVMEEWIFSLEK